MKKSIKCLMCLLVFASISQLYSIGNITSRAFEGYYCQSTGHQNSILPTIKEIDETNSRLPVYVAEGLLFTKVDYDTHTKIQSFYYQYTQDVDERMITPYLINQRKENMKNALRQNPKSMARVNAGMTYLYVYFSRNNTILYSIMINKTDFTRSSPDAL